MDLFALIRVVLRRWRIVVPVALLTLGLAYLVQTTTPPEYQASGFLELEGPELTEPDAAMSAINPVDLAQGIQLDGDGAGRNFTVGLVGGMNYSVSAVASSSGQAEDDASFVVDRLAQRISRIQEEQGVPTAERIDLRMMDPSIVAEQQADESWIATVNVFLNDPTALTTNPYGANPVTGRILLVAFQGDAAQAEFLQRAGRDITVTVGQNPQDAAPLLQVVTVGPDPDAVIDAFTVAQDIISADLEQRQARAGVSPGSMLNVGVLDAPLGVTDESPPVERATAGVIVLGGMLALGLALAFEGLDRRGMRPAEFLRHYMAQDSATRREPSDAAAHDPSETEHPGPGRPPHAGAAPSMQPAATRSPVGASGTSRGPSGPTRTAPSTTSAPVDQESNEVLEDKLRQVLATRSQPPAGSAPAGDDASESGRERPTRPEPRAGGRPGTRLTGRSGETEW